MDREDRAEDLLAHERGLRVLAEHDGRLDEVALAVVRAASGEDLQVRALLRLLDVARDLLERAAIDHRVHEVPEVARVAHPDAGEHLQE